MSQRKVIATHSGTFHADDVFAVAVLAAVFPLNSIIRTREHRLIDAADFAVDVGNAWHPLTGRFDHHQRDFKGARAGAHCNGTEIEGVGYASAGLVWREYGEIYIGKLLEDKGFGVDDVSVTKVASDIDASLVQYIDLVDTGKGSVAPGLFGLSALVSSLNSSWMEEQGLDRDAKAQLQMDRFNEAVRVVRRFLDQVIIGKISQVCAIETVRKSERLLGGRVLHLENGGMPWTRLVINEMPEVLLVIYPDTEGGQYQIRTVPIEPDSFKARLSLPASWAGLRDAEMALVTGVQDSVFCHINLFIGGAKSLQGVLELAALALSAGVD